jgi:glycosyltransferase involved in cell wall biosynthesis
MHSVRLALFSPWPPVRSGIADYARDLAAGLAVRHTIDIFVESASAAAGSLQGVEVRDAHDFPWRHARTPYELAIYQLGNSSAHDYMWPYLFRYPGLAVLHDGALHHARAAALLRRGRAEDYRAELGFDQPALPREAAELALNAFDGPIYYDWPMLRAVVTSARGVVVHSERLSEQLSADFPGTTIHRVSMGIPAAEFGPADTARVRARHGIASDAFVVGAFGGITPEKRIVPLLDAAAVIRRYHPRLRVLLVGAEHSHFDVLDAARTAGVADIVSITGYIDERELPAYLGAADVVSSLRFPTAGETSASWLRALAAGRPTLVTDLAQLAEVPTIDPRSRTVVHERPTMAPQPPVAVSIDILDEVHSMVLALKALASDASLREALGVNALAHWRAHHTVARMIDDYEHAIARAAATSPPAVTLPAHLRPDGFEHARSLAMSVGATLPDGWQ